MNLASHPELADRLAAAYALGTLRGRARRRFEAYARQHPRLKAQVLVWQERFAGMTELQADHVPDANVWKRIQNQLGVAGGSALHVPPPPIASQPHGLLGRLGGRLAWWRGAAVAGAVATVVAATVGLRLWERNTDLQAQLQSAPLVRYVAVLQDERQTGSVLVTFDPARSTLTLKRVGIEAPGPDKSLELWALPPGGSPRSLGVMDQAQVVRLPADESLLRGVPALAVTLEPRGGAPGGGPATGPVLFKGPLVEAPPL